jgi:hypothetical protein
VVIVMAVVAGSRGGGSAGYACGLIDRGPGRTPDALHGCAGSGKESHRDQDDKSHEQGVLDEILRSIFAAKSSDPLQHLSALLG